MNVGAMLDMSRSFELKGLDGSATECVLRIFDCRLTGETEAGMPGRVLRIADESFDVRLNGGVLRVMRVQPEGGKKVSAGEWAAAAGLKPGFRFRAVK